MLLLEEERNGYSSPTLKMSGFPSLQSMKITNRKADCRGCRCHSYNDVIGDRCQAGFKFELRHEKKPWGASYVPYPSEPCPRPTNYKDFEDAMYYEWQKRTEMMEKRKKEGTL